MVRVSPSRELCGTTPGEFAELLVRLAPLAERRKQTQQDRTGRLRAPGAGRKPRPFGLRLLVGLVQLRHNPPVRATAQLFAIHERSVRNWRDEIVALLAAHGCQPPGAARPIRSATDLVAYLDGLADATVVIDGTEVARAKPLDWDAQRKAWSGKTRTHVVKATVVSDASRRPLWFEANPTGEGRRHDITMLRAQAELLGALAATTALVIADAGYQSLHRDLGHHKVRTPRKRNPGRELDEATRDWNREMTAVRLRVEHAIGRMKNWRALRYWRRPVERFDQTGKAIATLASLI